MADWYAVGNVPGTKAALSSAVVRAEFLAVKTDISDKLPTYTGNASKIIAVNSGASGLEAITSVAVAQGGTGATTLTDGGVLLGSGTGAITAMAVLADNEMIVGDGTTDPVAESGATLRTSIGVGTGDSPQFTGIELGHATDTTITRASAGDINIEGNIAYRAGGTDVAVGDGGTGQSSFTNGQLLIGNTTGNTLAKATLTAGEGIDITNGTGTITILCEDASATNKGVIELLTNAEAVTGTDTVRAATAANLTAKMAAPGPIGATTAAALTATTGTFSDALKPSSNDISALGVLGTAWADLFLASGAVIDFGSDVFLTHSTNKLTLSSGDFTIGSNAFTAGSITGTTGTFSDNVSVAATKKLFLDGGGDTYITESSANNLDIIVAGGVTMQFTATSAQIWPTDRFYFDGGADTYFHENSANVLRGIAGGSGGVDLLSGGTSWTAVSDERYKTIIEPITGATEKIASLRAVIGCFKTREVEQFKPDEFEPDTIDDSGNTIKGKFIKKGAQKESLFEFDMDGIDEDRRRSFLIAQDVQKVFPEAVTVGEDINKTLNLSYTDVIPLLVAGIKEQQNMIDALDKKIRTLEAR